MSAGVEGRLLVAVPSKGRMAPPSLELLAAAGLRFEAGERALHVPCQNAPVDLLLVRPHDIPEYVQDGVVHLGITGANLVAEARADVVRLADLGFARCTLEAAVPTAAPYQELADLAGVRVATAYPVSTRAALAEAGVEAELVTISGSVEAAPRLGLSEAVVDLVSTGSTASVERAAPDRPPALVRGGPDRQPGRARGAARAGRAGPADARGRRRRAAAAVRDAECVRGGPAGDPRAASRDGRTVGAPARRARPDRRARRGRRGRRSGTCSRR